MKQKIVHQIWKVEGHVPVPFNVSFAPEFRYVPVDLYKHLKPWMRKIRVDG